MSERGATTHRLRLVGFGPDSSTVRSALLVAALIGGLSLILVSPLFSPQPAVQVGRPSPVDIEAPRSITYVSQLLTERARERAAAAVGLQFKPLDPEVAGRQAERAREVLAHISLVRSDPYASAEEKQAELAQVPELEGLAPEILERLLALDEETWQRVTREVPVVVAQVLRQPVRPDTLDIARGSVVANVDRSMAPETAQLVAAIGQPFIVPNTQVDQAKTNAARLAARQAEPEVVRSYSAGETIVRAGDIVTEEHLEALTQLGLAPTATGWRDVLGMGLLVLALVAVGAGVLLRLKPGWYERPQSITLVVLLLLVFTLGARILVPGRTVLAYAYPAPAVAMTLTALFGLETGVMAGITLALVTGLVAGSGLELTVYVMVGSLAGAVALSRLERLGAFLLAGASVAVASLAVILGFHLPDPLAMRTLAELTAAAVAQAALSTGLAVLGIMAGGAVFGVTTSLQLLELARPDQPLLRRLQTRAPGTYQHSIVVANMAEAAATAIGADALLVRVGAYYHDLGKTQRPYFFFENQMGAANPHDKLDPYTSARIVIDHVTAGAQIGRQHGLPEAIIDFMLEHHGTTRAEYFYRTAVEAAGDSGSQVDEAAFRYPGPRPRSRETAIVMLADGTEAAVRAAGPEGEAIETVMGRIFQARLRDQLDDCDLTLSDLTRIRDAFLGVLQSMYHPRIRYPAEGQPPPGDSQQADARRSQTTDLAPTTRS